MSSKVKGIIICLVVLLCLGAMLLVLKLLPEKKTDSSSDEPVSQSSEGHGDISLLSDVSDKLDSSMVLTIEFESKNGKVKIEQEKQGEESFKISALDGITQTETIYTAVADTVCGLKAKDLVEENAENMDKYGLTSPQATFTARFNVDGQTKEKTFLIGDESPEDSYFYLCESGKKTVYTVYSSSLSYFFYTNEDFVSLSMLSALPSDADEKYFTSLVVKQKARDYDIVFENDDEENSSMVSSQVMTSPIFSYLDVTNSSLVTHGMWGLSAQRAVAVHPGEKEMKKYGLSDPTATAKLKCIDGEYTLTIGNPEYVKDSDGDNTETIDGYYAYISGVDGKDVIFYCAADDLPWASFGPSDVISGLMTTNNVMDLKGVRFSTKDIDVSYALEISEENENGNKEVLSVTENEKTKLDPEVWKGWYQLLIQCPTNEIYFSEPKEKTPAVTVDIMRLDGVTDTMQLFKETDRRYIVKLNGKTSFRIESGWVDAIINGIQKVRDGEEINADAY